MSKSSTLAIRVPRWPGIRRTHVPFAAALIAGLGWAAMLPMDRGAETAAYVSQFSQAAYETAGTDFLNARYDPRRLGKPLNRIDTTYDYDFARLEEVSGRLQGVDRRKALKAIFDAVTAGVKTEVDRHRAVLRFLHKVSFHSRWLQPMHRSGQAVLDPLVLLELGEMRCGQVARIAADLYEAAGYRARIVQAAAHVSAEVFYDGGWHLVEGDMSGGGVIARIDGKVPSVAELSRQPFLIDMLPARQELAVYSPPDVRLASTEYPSYYFFSKRAYGDLKPAQYYKEATRAQAAGSEYYGWNYWRTEHDEERKLWDFAPRYEPGAPRLRSVEVKDGEVRIAWDPSEDKDGDLLGYRVYLSEQSRGWNYPTFSGDASAKAFWNGGDWRPEMYDALFRQPPSDIARYVTQETSISFPLHPAERLYVTIVPFDMHGERVRRKLYRASEELVFQG